MAGTKEGGFRTRDTNRKLHGKDYYARIGKSGGLARVPKGFAMLTPEQRSEVSQKAVMRRFLLRAETAPEQENEA